MVEIRSCNGDFRKIYFLQRAALSEYLALIFFRGTVVFGNSYCKKDHLKALNSCSGNIFLTWDLVVIDCFGTFFSSSMFISIKVLVLVRPSFRVITIISIEFSQLFIHSAVLQIFVKLKFVVILFYQSTFFQCISEYQSQWNKLLLEAAIFSEQHQLCWNENSHSKQLLFR